MNLGTKNQRFTLIWPNPGKWYWSLPWFYDSFFSNTPAESGSFDTWHKAVIDVFITKLPKRTQLSDDCILLKKQPYRQIRSLQISTSSPKLAISFAFPQTMSSPSTKLLHESKNSSEKFLWIYFKNWCHVFMILARQ